MADDALTVALLPAADGVSVDFRGLHMVEELGASVRSGVVWHSTFDGSLNLDALSQEQEENPLGAYHAQTLTYRDSTGPLVRQTLTAYLAGRGESAVIVETTTLRDITGAATEDSYFHTTFNSPVMRLNDDLNYLAYTWGLQGGEGVGMGGNFPDAAIASTIGSLSEQLRLADFSPDKDVHQTGDKPFAPLIAYGGDGLTMVASPLDHFLISPMRLLETSKGAAVARGLHGAVDRIPSGTSTKTILVFGQGMPETVYKWGSLMASIGRDGAPKRAHGPELDSLGFWNCYGGYYAQLFRPTTAETLRDLSRSFTEKEVPVRYFGLDLWYPHRQVGFSQSYRPDPEKYPDGLEAVSTETGLPLLLHLSAFDKDNVYNESHSLAVEEGAAYPRDPKIYEDLASDFKSWGAAGVWHDFLRTQLQNCQSLRSELGQADAVFDWLARSMGERDLDLMMCMPTMGHYLASSAHDNVVAVRTSTDYVNHQARQVEMLAQNSETRDEYRAVFPPGRNLRQNLFLSFLAGALGLAPSYDVFITNGSHPEGFADPDPVKESLARALSAGIVGIGDKLGHVDNAITDRLAFPDGRLAQPDHPPIPLTGTMQSDVTVFYTTTTVGGHVWTYIALWNLAEEARDYSFDLTPLLHDGDLVYDYFGGELVSGPVVEGLSQPGLARYLVAVPSVGGVHPLGFPSKYVTLPRAQVKDARSDERGVSLELDLPEGLEYTFATLGGPPISASGAGIQVLETGGQGVLRTIRFLARSRNCILELKL